MVKPTKLLWLWTAVLAALTQILLVFVPGRIALLLWAIMFIVTIICLVCYWESHE